MAIDYCHKHEAQWDRDKHTDCPRCQTTWVVKVNPEMLKAAESIEPDAVFLLTDAACTITVTDEPRDLIRILRDETNNRDVLERCKRVLGEA